MQHTFAQMEQLCIEMAIDAPPDTAAALRTVAQNYTQVIEPAQNGPTLSLRQILLIALAVYSLWTPFFLTAPPAALEVAPTGHIVERLDGFVPTADGRSTTRTYRFQPRERFVNGVRQFTYVDVPLLVYENTTPLPADRYEIQPLAPENAWRFVTVAKVEPGHRYYIVQP